LPPPARRSGGADRRRWATSLLILYSHITVDPQTTFDVRRVEAPIGALFGLLQPNAGEALHGTALETLTNVLEHLLVAREDTRDSPVMWKAAHFASTFARQSGYHGPDLSFYAMLTCFPDAKKTGRKFWRHWFENLKVTNQSAGMLLSMCHFSRKHGNLFMSDVRTQTVTFIAENPTCFSNYLIGSRDYFCDSLPSMISLRALGPRRSPRKSS
jgi:hypothetical protein